jgi:hypothetical protein
MSKTKVTQTPKKPGNTPITEDSASDLAELVLEKLDKVDYRGGRAIEYRESSNGGIVRIYRDDGGRIHFRTPSAQVSLRAAADRSNRLLSHDNRRKLESFLQRNPAVLSFLEQGRIR